MRRPGVSVFETMRVRRGAIPLLSRHLARLARSLSALGLPAADRDLDAFVVPFTEMDEAVLHLEVRDGRAAVTVGGVPGGGSPVVITAVARHERYPHKTTDRDCFEEAAAEADRAEADDALLLTAEGWVAEGTVWNVLWWEESDCGRRGWISASCRGRAGADQRAGAVEEGAGGGRRWRVAVCS